MINNQTSLPRLFKGIALFTPGGDLIYGIDSTKQTQWHIHLCLGLQQIFNLSEPPHFLVPAYTATVDRWLEKKTQQIRISAEIYPAVLRYQPLLQVLFETEEVVWQTVPWQEEYCYPLMIESYRHEFPQLWEDHNLIVRLDPNFNNRPKKVNQSKTAEYDSHLAVYSQSEKQKKKDNSEISSLLISSNSSEDIKPFSNSSKNNGHGYVLCLFISNDNAAVEKTLTKIYQLLEEGLVYPYTLKVIDISKNPEKAENYHIAATPTLVRVWPQPVRRIVGQLDDFERVLQIISSF